MRRSLLDDVKVMVLIVFLGIVTFGGNKVSEIVEVDVQTGFYIEYGFKIGRSCFFEGLIRYNYVDFDIDAVEFPGLNRINGMTILGKVGYGF